MKTDRLYALTLYLLNHGKLDYGNKDTFNWIAVIRLLDFVTKKDFKWAVEAAIQKRKGFLCRTNID